MKNKLYVYLFFILNSLFSVEVVVNPYLQSATPNSIKILWETDSESQTIVEWDIQPFLTESTSGFSFSNYENSKIHTVIIWMIQSLVIMTEIYLTCMFD